MTRGVRLLSTWHRGVPPILAKALLICCALALFGGGVVAVGCGEDEEAPAERLVKGLPEEDVERLESWSAYVRDSNPGQAEMARGFQQQDVKTARKGLDAFAGKLSEAERATADFENAEMRTILRDYVRPLIGYADAAERFIVLWEKETSSGVSADEEETQAILAEMEQTAAAAKTSEKKMLERIRAVASPEQREEIDKQVREATEKFKEQAGTAPGG